MQCGSSIFITILAFFDQKNDDTNERVVCERSVRGPSHTEKQFSLGGGEGEREYQKNE
jgi:hypothetical protein